MIYGLEWPRGYKFLTPYGCSNKGAAPYLTEDWKGIPMDGITPGQALKFVEAVADGFADSGLSRESVSRILMNPIRMEAVKKEVVKLLVDTVKEECSSIQEIPRYDLGREEIGEFLMS